MNAVTLITISFTFNLRLGQYCVEAEGIVDFTKYVIYILEEKKERKGSASGGEKPMNKQGHVKI